MSVPSLHIEMVQHNDVLLFKPVGWIATDGHVIMEEKLHEAFGQGHRLIVIDLSAAHFVSSTGLGVFLYFRQVLDDAGGRLVLAAPGGAVQRMLVAANLDQALTICPSVAEAVKKIKPKPPSRRARTANP